MVLNIAKRAKVLGVVVCALVLQLLHLGSRPVCSLCVQDVFFCLQGP